MPPIKLSAGVAVGTKCYRHIDFSLLSIYEYRYSSHTHATWNILPCGDVVNWQNFVLFKFACVIFLFIAHCVIFIFPASMYSRQSWGLNYILIQVSLPSILLKSYFMYWWEGFSYNYFNYLFFKSIIIKWNLTLYFKFYI